MDISVSRLNNRMVLQVPAELPLGLVLIVGQVHDLEVRNGETHLDLIEAGHILHCRLTRPLTEEVLLKNGDTVRAGGHLAFDVQSARYYLLARDIEVAPGMAASRRQMAPILSDVRKRADAAGLVRADLPPWVKRLAPPEVRAELALLEQEAPAAAGAETQRGGEGVRAGNPASAASTDEEMLAFLSAAMDRADEVELTPEVLARFLPIDSQPGRERTAQISPAESQAADSSLAGGGISAGVTSPATPAANTATITDRLLLAAIVLLVVMLLIVLVLLLLTVL